MEIEIKAMLTKEDWLKYEDLMNKKVPNVDSYIRKDTYYSKYDTLEQGASKNEPLIRIREEVDLKADKVFNTDYYLTIKRKQLLNNAETNVEIENAIAGKEPSSILELLSITGYKPVFTKVKETRGYHTKNGLHVELVKVANSNKTLYALEIEKIVNESSILEYSKIIDSEILYMSKVFSPDLVSHIESKTWKVLLEE